MRDINLPNVFKVNYLGECGAEYEMYNALLPEITLPCDECGERHMFFAEYIEHHSWEWDYEDESD